MQTVINNHHSIFNMKKILGLLLLLLSMNSFGQNADKEMIPYFANGKWGYCDKDMKIKIPCQYDQAFPFFEERALVQLFDTIEPYTRSYFIDPSGKVAIDLKSAAMACPASRFQNGKALVENYNREVYGDFSTLSLIDKNGNVLQQIDSAALDMNLSMLNEYGKPFDENGIYVGQSGVYEMKSFLLYEDGRKPLFMDYDYITPFNNGFAIAMKPYRDGQINPDMTIINTKGEELIPAGKFQFFMEYGGQIKNTDGLYPYIDNEKYGYVNLKGEVVIAPKYDMAFSFSEGLAVVGEIYDMDEYETPIYRYGYINTKGTVLIPMRFDVAHAFTDGFAEVAVKDSILFLDKTGKTAFAFKSAPSGDFELLMPTIYGVYFYDHGFIDGKAILLKDGKVGWINKKGEFLIEPLYSGVGRIGPSMLVNKFENGLCRVGPTSVLQFNEFYIDESGKPYFEPSPVLLPLKEMMTKRYAAPSKNMILDTMYYYETPVFKRFTGKKDKIDGKKGEWIEIDNWGTKAYVFSADFNTNCLKTSDVKGTPLYDAKDAKNQIHKLAAGSLIFLAPKEKASKIGTANMINVIYYDYSPESESGYARKSLWIRGDQVKLMIKK
jgi:hypothetical protein